jgi:hypothetical protein
VPSSRVSVEVLESEAVAVAGPTAVGVPGVAPPLDAEAPPQAESEPEGAPGNPVGFPLGALAGLECCAVKLAHAALSNE